MSTYEEAAAAFPEKAKWIDTLHGKRRARERRKLRDALGAIRTEKFVTYLREAGKCCSKCNNYSTLHGGICELLSDFHGYVNVKPNHICSNFREAKP